MNKIFNESIRVINSWINNCTNNEITAVGIIATIIIAFISLYCIRRPKLTYMMTLSRISFPKDINNLRNLLQIKYNKKNITNLSVVKIVITNEGREIAKNFSNPIKITSASDPIIYAKIDSTETSENLKVMLTEDPKKEFVNVEVDYLNENDKIVIYLAFDTDKRPELSFSARCHGCSSIKKVDGPKILRTILTILLVISLFVAFVLYNVSASFKKEVDILEVEVKKHRQAVLEGYRKLYSKYETDEKNIVDIKEKIKTPSDILEAYVSCDSSLKYYIDFAKDCVLEKIQKIDLEKNKSTQLPK